MENSHGFAIATIGSLDVSVDPDSPDGDKDGLSDSLEIYLAFLGLDPSVDSTLQWEGLKKIVGELGLGEGNTAELEAQLAAVEAERDARPTTEELAAITAERDARPTADELQDARNGSVVINSSNGEAIISFNIEESEDLKTWQATGEKITKTIQLKEGKKFYRFALDK